MIRKKIMFCLLLSAFIVIFAASCTDNNVTTPFYIVDPSVVVEYSSCTIVLCFYAESIGTITGDITISKDDDGIIQIGLESFDAIAKKYEFMDIERMYYVNNPEWKGDKGVHIMNIFRVTIKVDDIVDEAISVLNDDENIIFVEREYRDTIF